MEHKDGWKRFKKGSKWQYDISELGYKYNMTDISAALGLWQLNNYKKWLKRRKYIAKTYHSNLREIDGITLPDFDENSSESFHLYILRIVKDLWKISRNEIIAKLNEFGIGTSVHYIPVHMHSYYQKKYGFKPNDFPFL